MPSRIHRAIRQAAPGHKPPKVNVKRSSVFILVHHWGYQFGILHHRCFIELYPHQGSAGSFDVPEATVFIFETSNKIAIVLCVGWFTLQVLIQYTLQYIHKHSILYPGAHYAHHILVCHFVMHLFYFCVITST